MRNLNKLCLLLLAFLFTTGLFAQQESDYAVHFRYGKTQFDANAASLTSMLQLNPDEIYKGKFYRFIQFFQLPTSAEMKQMEALGVEFLEYIPNNVYLAAIPTTFNFSSWSSLGIRSIEPLRLAQKLDQRLEERPFPVWAMVGSELRAQVSIYKNADYHASVAALLKMGFTIVESDDYSKIVHIKLNSNLLERVAMLPYIRYVDLPANPGKPESDDGRNLHRANMIDRDYAGSYAFDGTGVSVVINDDGFAGPHIDFQGRANQSNVATDLTGNHGDGTAGIVGSAGNLNPLMRGMATGAYLHVRQYTASLPNTVTLHVDSAVMVFSNSYSDGCNDGYTTTARKVDQEIYTNPNLMQVFSAGNSNGQNCGYGAGTQWGNITGGHKVGKNCIATANLDANDAIATSSSRGPAHDGRIKPDIAAHGQNQMSNDEDYTYQVFGGTSAACPGIAGVMAQLQQAYRSFNAAANAPSALLKAALMNTTNELGTDGPDFIYGWGKVNAYKALKVLEENRYISGTISQAGTASHTVAIPAGVTRARIMIYWADKEASISTNRALVNNLNMTVSSPSATIHHPWILNSTPNATTLAQAATRTGTLDSLNNVEQVAIDNPAAGNYTVNITAPTVPFGPQTYYIVYEFFTDEVTVVFPVGGEGLLPGTNDRIHWDAFGNNGTFTVQASTNNGGTWTNVATNVAAAARFVTYPVPNTVTGQARVRVTRGSVSDESDANFSIIGRPTNLAVVAVCTAANSIRLTWNAVTSATSYDVFMLGQKYMDSVGTAIATTTFDVPVPNISATYWFAVRARGANSCVGLRTIAIQYIGGAGSGSACLLDCGNNNDAGVTQIISPAANQQSCNGNNFDVTVQLSNISTNAQSNFPVYYRVGTGTTIMQTYTGTLAGGVQANFTFTQQLTLNTPGIYNLKVWTGLTADGAICNDTMNLSINFSNPIGTFPYVENFQSGTFSPVNSYISNPDGGRTWATKTCIGRNGASTISMYIDNYYYNSAGEEDIFGLVSMDLTTAVGAQLSFDLAYAPYNGYPDALRIEVSTDCGQTFTQIYSKSGATLGTAAAQTAVFTPNSAAQWRNEVVNLTPYIGNYVALRFTGTTAYGNDVFIDNINIASVASMPSAAFGTNIQNICAGTAVNFSDQTTGGPASWAWTFGDGSTSTLQNPSYTYTSGGVYTVRLISTNAAGSDTLINSNYINVAQANFSNDANSSGQLVNFSDQSIGASTWAWTFGDGNTSTQQNPSHTYTTPGTYTITLVINGTCSVNTTISVGAVAVNTLENNVFAAQLLPNPATQQTVLSLAKPLAEDMNVELIAVDGRILRSMQLPAGLSSMSIECAALPPAMYYLRLTSKNLSETRKFVKQQ